jgi:hypothetical protein
MPPDWGYRIVIRNSETDRLEQTVEAEYLRLCDPEKTLHFFTVWTTRGEIS